LAEEAVRDYIDWEQLMRKPLPNGLSAAETWEVLALIRRYGAAWFPIPTLDGEWFWYSLTREGQRCLRSIEHHCRTDSLLHQRVQEREGHRFLVRSRIEEAVATCQLDGVQIDYQRAAAMLQEGRAAQSPEDRLVLNSYQMLHELETLSAEPFSPELMEFLYNRVTQGVEMRALKRGPIRTNLAGSRNATGLSEDERGDVARAICDYANGVIGEPLEPAPVKGYMILSAMAYWHPLPDLNDTVARHMLRLFALKSDYPALGYLPVSLLMREWFDGELSPGTVRFPKIERRTVLEGEIDGTEDILTHLQLTAAAIDELLGYIETARLEDEALLGALENVEQLNYRQRAVLAHALAHPEVEFRIRRHQTAHRIVYQTARTDLLQLADYGYLRKESRGKAFAFVPVAEFEDRLRKDRNGVRARSRESVAADQSPASDATTRSGTV